MRIRPNHIDEFVHNSLLQGRIIFDPCISRTISFDQEGNLMLTSFDRHAHQEQFRENPDQIIEGDCEAIASGIAGALEGLGLVDNATCVFSTAKMHFACIATKDGKQFFIDCGRRRPIPHALEINGLPKDSEIYERPLKFSATTEPETITRCTITDSVTQEIIDNKTYIPFSEPFPLRLLRQSYGRDVPPVRVTFKDGKRVIEDLSSTERGGKGLLLYQL